jgi:putative protease
MKKIRDDEYNGMCEQAKKAFELRVEKMPDKYLPYVLPKEGWKMYPLTALNMIDKNTELELVSPDINGKRITFDDFKLVNPNTGEVYNWVCADHPCVIYTGEEIPEGTLLRSKNPEYVEGKIRDTGR